MIGVRDELSGIIACVGSNMDEAWNAQRKRSKMEAMKLFAEEESWVE